MIYYDYGYKYLKANIGNHELVVELSLDNFMKQKTFSAKTNYLFFDENEQSWGHACGVGQSETDALQMCVNEIKAYTGVDVNFQDLYCPQRISFEKNDKNYTLYFKIIDKTIHIMTPNGVESIEIKGDVLDTILGFCKKYSGEELDARDKVFEQNDFIPIFENSFERYQ